MSSDFPAFPWLNSDYIKTILAKYEGHENFEVNDFSIGSGSAMGENFAGVIHRVKINYTMSGIKKEASFILKTSPQAGAVAELLENLNVYEGEVYMYHKIHNECESLLSGFKMAPSIIYADENALVLEDLTTINYVLANRKERFNLTKSKLVLEKIAKFHAITAKMYENKPDSIVHMASAYDEETPLTFFLGASFQESMETISSTTELQQYLPKLENFDIVQEEKNIYTRVNNDRFRVLNHGDLWINNIFFKYDELNNPVDALLVDYQESFFGSPGIDFNHFLYTSCDFNVHSKHFDELIKFYYDTLISALKQLNYLKIPTYDDIKYEIRNKAKQGLICLLSVVPVQMIENPEHANPEYFLADTEEAQVIRQEVYGNPKYVDVLKVLLPSVLNRVNNPESHI
ncbi:hypothetical protein PVAND_014252 [Polypedilum vanderplanki]|uniref:CHK kinase-like domain-containing protein n=1 Tax=Polypedilum vanderplanki TaxID=319348 RepID=A0A9J6CRS7_POLVA|nr:hypothetical protein PVAND_014252 [Polypedilum vanderplanki]